MHNNLLLDQSIGLFMKNGVVLYLEDNEDGTVRILARVIGDPDQSRELADEILFDLVGAASSEAMLSAALH